MSTAQLCSDCIAFTKWLSSKPAEDDYDYPKDGEALVESRSSCNLCHLLIYHVIDADRIKTAQAKIERDWDHQIAGITFRFQMQKVTHFDLTRLFIWCDKHSSAQSNGSICALAPLRGHGDLDAISRMREWIARCSSTHHSCRRSFAGMLIEEEEAPLPCDRILDVNASEDLIRLVHTGGLRGRYCTVSHCWGPPDKKPMCVTTANEHTFFAGFSRDILPQTFRDAVDVARALGIRYLWIDSLCRVQDSEAHWQSESAKMGTIYEGAYLRLAASKASDSTQGFYRSFDDLSPIEVPYQPPDMDADGLLHIQLTLRQDFSFREPLSLRAWAFQESRLARRTVLFTNCGIVWSCKCGMLSERNSTHENSPEASVQVSNWQATITHYSACNLTYESDRFIALQGLANEVAKTKTAEYYLGIWTDELPQLLLWRVGDPSTAAFVGTRGVEGTVECPTWSWAHLPGQKSYFYHGYPEVSIERQVGPQFQYLDKERNSLTFAGNFWKCNISTDDADGKSFRYIIRQPESMFMGHRDMLKRLLWYHDEQGKEVVGLVQIDEDRRYGALYCSIILVAARTPHDQLLRWADEANHGFTHGDIPDNWRTWHDLNANWDSESGDDSALTDWGLIKRHGQGKHYYWALLLEAVPDEQNTFRRVGMGIVWPKPCIENRLPDEIFHLV